MFPFLPSPTGPQGEQGDQGIQGIPGPAGQDGTPGANGADGADGKSAFESAQEGGYVGTEAEFYAALSVVSDAILSQTIRHNVVLTVSQYQALVAAGTVDPNTAYDIIEDAP